MLLPFCDFTESVAQVFRRRMTGKNVHIFVFVDDFLIVGDTREDTIRGMEALEASFVLTAYDADVLALWGISEGQAINATARGAVESHDGSTVKPAVHRLRGKITSLARGTWQPGQQAPLTVTMRLEYYAEELAGQQLHEIDIPNMVRRIGGVDQLAARRAALGI